MKKWIGINASLHYSLESPQAYLDSNLIGFVNILGACRHHEVKHSIYASSSSVMVPI